MLEVSPPRLIDVAGTMTPHPTAQTAGLATARHRAKIRRWLVAVSLFGLVVLVALLTLDIGPLVRPLALRALGSLAARLGQSAQPVQIDVLHLYLFPRVRLVASGVRLGTLGTLEALRAEMAFPALLRPHPLRLDLVALDRPALRLLRKAQSGSIGNELTDLINRLQHQGASSDDLLQRVALARLEIDGGTLSVDDEDSRQRYEVTQIHVDAPIGNQGASQLVTVTAAVLSPHPNLSLDLDLHSGDLRVRQLDISFAGIVLHANADLRGLRSSPQIHSLQIEAQAAALERLLPLLPLSLPKGFSLHGPARLVLSAAGSPSQPTVQGELDLGSAAIRMLPIEKAAGERLLLKMTAHLHASPGALEAELDPLDVSLAALTLSLRGRIRSSGTAELNLRSTTGDLGALLRLMPAAHRSLAGAKGHLRLEGELQKGVGSLTARLCVPLLGANLAPSGLHLRGDFQACATLRRSGQEAHHLSLSANLDHAHLSLAGAAGIDKPEGQPLRLAAEIDLEKHRTQLRSARLQLPAATLQATASLEGEHLHIASLELHQGKGQLRGTADLTGWPPHELHFDLEGTRLDLGSLDGLHQGGSAEPGGAMLLGLKAAGRLRLVDQQLAGIELSELQADVVLQRGVLVLKMLRAQLGQGSVDLGGSSFDLKQHPLRGNLQARIHELDLRLLRKSSHGTGPQVIAGQVSGTVALEVVDLPWEQLAPRLAGSIKLDATGLQLRNLVLRGTLVNPLLRRISAHRSTEQAPREAVIERLHLSGQFAGGQLRLDEPLSLNSSEMQGTLQGSIGLAGTLSLTGDLELKPQAIAAATKGQLVLAGPVPLRVRISGQQSAPQIELLELDRTVRELVRQRLRGLLPRP
jgi:hypothetical protein